VELGLADVLDGLIRRTGRGQRPDAGETFR